MRVTKKYDTPTKPALVTRPAKKAPCDGKGLLLPHPGHPCLGKMPRRVSLVTRVVFLGEWVGPARLPSEQKN